MLPKNDATPVGQLGGPTTSVGFDTMQKHRAQGVSTTQRAIDKGYCPFDLLAYETGRSDALSDALDAVEQWAKLFGEVGQ